MLNKTNCCKIKIDLCLDITDESLTRFPVLSTIKHELEPYAAKNLV